MKTDTIFFIVYILITISFFILGFYLYQQLFQDDIPKQKVLGIWFKNYNITEVNNYINGLEPQGRWICVKIDGRNESELLSTWHHELAHEIFDNNCFDNKECFNFIYSEASESFARVCQRNITKCMDFVVETPKDLNTNTTYNN